MADDDWKEGLALAVGLMIFIYILMQICPTTGPEACPAGQVFDPICPAACPCHAPVGACACTEDCPAERLKPDWTCCPDGSVWDADLLCCSVGGVCFAELCVPATRICPPGIGDCPAGGCCPFASTWSGTSCLPEPGEICSAEGATCLLTECCEDLVCTQSSLCVPSIGLQPGDCIPASRLSPTGVCCPVGSSWNNVRYCCWDGASCIMGKVQKVNCPAGTYWNYIALCCTTSPTCESSPPGPDATCALESQSCATLACCDGLSCTGGVCASTLPVECQAESQFCDATHLCCESLSCVSGTCQTGASFCPLIQQCPGAEPNCPAGDCCPAGTWWDGAELCCTDGTNCFFPPACDHANPAAGSCTGDYVEGDATTCCPGFECDLTTNSCIATSTAGWYCIAFSQVGACVNSCNEAEGGVMGVPFPACVCDCSAVTCEITEVKNPNDCSCVALMPSCSIPDKTVWQGATETTTATFVDLPVGTNDTNIKCNETDALGATIAIVSDQASRTNCKYFVPENSVSWLYQTSAETSGVATCFGQITVNCNDLGLGCAATSQCCDMCPGAGVPACQVTSGVSSFTALTVQCIGGACQPCLGEGESCYDVAAQKYVSDVCCPGLGCGWSKTCTVCKPTPGDTCDAFNPCCGGMSCILGSCIACLPEGGTSPTAWRAEDCCSYYETGQNQWTGSAITFTAYGDHSTDSGPADFQLGFNHCMSVTCPAASQIKQTFFPSTVKVVGCCPFLNYMVGGIPYQTKVGAVPNCCTRPDNSCYCYNWAGLCCSQGVDVCNAWCPLGVPCS